MAAMRALAVALTVTLVPAALACVRDGAPPVAPVVVEVARMGDAGLTPIPLAPAPPLATRERCSARLTAGAIKTGAGCTLDERLSGGEGLLLFPCSGTGAVEAVFGEHRFQGRLTETTVTLALTTELDWEDGCHWETKQAIRGELKRERGTHPKLVWTYSEAPVTGTSCFGSCRATADIDADDLPP